MGHGALYGFRNGVAFRRNPQWRVGLRRQPGREPAGIVQSSNKREDLFMLNAILRAGRMRKRFSSGPRPRFALIK
jgi:hypothetical protein